MNLNDKKKGCPVEHRQPHHLLDNYKVRGEDPGVISWRKYHLGWV